MNKRLALLLTTFIFSTTTVFAVEAPLYFGDEKYPIKQNILLLDSNDTGGDLSIQFGDTLNKLFSWDSDATPIGGDTNGLFSFSDGVEIYENNSETGLGLGLTIANAGTGDAILQFLLNAVQRWVVGIDNSDSDKFKIASSTDLNTDARLTIDTTGKVGIGTSDPSANLDIYTADGVTRLGEAFPNKTASTDNGIGMYNAVGGFKSGLFTEVNGELLSYGINISQIGDRDTTKTGGIFRMDTRATSPYFSVKRQAIGGSTEYSDIQISQAGDIGMGGWASDTNSFPGNVSVLSRAAAILGLVIRGAASQTANLQEWQNNAGTVLSSVSSAGALTIGQSGTAITRHLSNTASLDFGNIDGSCANLTITVTGAVAGDTAVATPTPVTGGIETDADGIWAAYVSAANTVTVRVCDANPAQVAFNPAAQTWRVDVWQH